MNAINITLKFNVKKMFTPIKGDNITAISVSDDEEYLGIGSDGGLIYIYRVDNFKKNNWYGKKIYRHTYWEAHTNKVTGLCFIKTDLSKNAHHDR